MLNAIKYDSMKYLAQSFIMTFIVLMAIPQSSKAQLQSNDVETALLQVIVTYQEYQPRTPWKSNPPATRYGYGILINDSKIITTESLVRNHKLVQLRKQQDGEKINARVIMKDPSVNLALLEVTDKDKLDGLTRVRLAEKAPDKGQTIEIYQMDQTQEVQKSTARILKIFMDQLPRVPYSSLVYSILSDVNVNGQAAMAMYDGKMVGLMMSYSRSSRSGKMLPCNIIKQFVDDASEVPYKGFATAGFVWRPLIDPVRRAYLGAHQKKQGIIIISSLPGTDAHNVFLPDDIILEWDGRKIDNLGFYEDPMLGRMSMTCLIKYYRSPGDIIKVKILRDKAEQVVDIKLTHRVDSDNLIPFNVGRDQAEYIIEGGLIIRELTADYLFSYGGDWKDNLDSRLVHIFNTAQQTPEKPGDRIVILASVLPDEINIGYHQFRNAIIEEINGEKINNMSDVFKIMDRDGKLKRISLLSNDVDIVLSEKDLEAANVRIANVYRISALRNQKVAGQLQ